MLQFFPFLTIAFNTDVHLKKTQKPVSFILPKYVLSSYQILLNFILTSLQSLAVCSVV